MTEKLEESDFFRIRTSSALQVYDNLRLAEALIKQGGAGNAEQIKTALVKAKQTAEAIAENISDYLERQKNG